MLLPGYTKQAATILDPIFHDPDHISTGRAIARGVATDAGSGVGAIGGTAGGWGVGKLLERFSKTKGKWGVPASVLGAILGGNLGSLAGGYAAFNKADKALAVDPYVEELRKATKGVGEAAENRGTGNSINVPDNITVTHRIKFFDDTKPGEKGMLDTVEDKSKELWNKLTSGL